jgi:hypothetical protein
MEYEYEYMLSWIWDKMDKIFYSIKEWTSFSRYKWWGNRKDRCILREITEIYVNLPKNLLNPITVDAANFSHTCLLRRMHNCECKRLWIVYMNLICVKWATCTHSLLGILWTVYCLLNLNINEFYAELFVLNKFLNFIRNFICSLARNFKYFMSINFILAL